MNRVALLKKLDEEQRELLRRLVEEVSFQNGTVIFQQGKTAEFLYLVINGMVDMSFKPYDGIPLTVSHVGRGGLFGWSAVVGSEKYTSSAIAIENVKALRVNGNQLRKLCVEHPEAGDRKSTRLNSSH